MPNEQGVRNAMMRVPQTCSTSTGRSGNATMAYDKQNNTKGRPLANPERLN
jgi:hypothetical protein